MLHLVVSMASLKQETLLRVCISASQERHQATKLHKFATYFLFKSFAIQQSATVNYTNCTYPLATFTCVAVRP